MISAPFCELSLISRINMWRRIIVGTLKNNITNFD